MKQAAIQVESEAADVRPIGGIGVFIEKLLAIEVVYLTIGCPGGAHDVVVEVDGARLKRSAGRICARPDHQFCPEIREVLPQRRPIYIEADGEPDTAEVSLENSDGLAGAHAGMPIELLTERIDLIVSAGDAAVPVEHNGGIQAPFRALSIDRTDNVCPVFGRQAGKSGDRGAIQIFRAVVVLSAASLRQRDDIGAASALLVD